MAVVENAGLVQVLADLGVVLLLFFVGLELGLDQLFSNRIGFARAGAMDVGISLPVGFALGLAFGFTWLEAAFIALIVFNSSTVSIAKSLIDLEWIANPESDGILGVIVIEDILTALGFAVLSVFLVGGTDASAVASRSLSRSSFWWYCSPRRTMALVCWGGCSRRTRPSSSCSVSGLSSPALV